MKLQFSLLSAFAAIPFLTGTSSWPAIRRDASSDLLDGLNRLNLTALHSFFTEQQAVLQQVTSSPGLKTLLAPTDEAMKLIPNWTLSNVELFQSTILMHFLNGTFESSMLEGLPLHTVGHSFLTNNKYATLPGGNGQAVALYSEVDRANFHFVEEAINIDRFSASPLITGDFIVQPVRLPMTIPGNATFTIGFVEKRKMLAKLISQSQMGDTLDTMRGITIFAPSDLAVQQFMTQYTDVTPDKLMTILKNHIIFNRAAYSPLLVSQGNLITSSGQDLLFDSSTHTIRVGQDTAKITQYDIIHRGGVIHLIDQVLTNLNLDQGRADQAAKSAEASSNSYVAGPVSDQNAASSQGPNLPESNDGTRMANSTVQTHDATKGGANDDAIAGAAGTNSDSNSDNGEPHGDGIGTDAAVPNGTGSFVSSLCVGLLSSYLLL